MVNAKKILIVLISIIMITSGMLLYNNQNINKNNIINNNEISSNIQCIKNGSGYVEYTLMLYNNKLLNGDHPAFNCTAMAHALSYNPYNHYMYAAATVNNKGYVFVINPGNSIIKNITVGKCPYGISYDPENNYVYVANRLSNNVSMINSTTNKVIKNINVGKCPSSIVYDQYNHYIYVTNALSNNVSVINSSKILENINVEKFPFGAIYDPEDHYIYVSNYLSGNISVINSNTNKVIKNINVGLTTFKMAYDPENHYIYFSKSESCIYYMNPENNYYIQKIHFYYNTHAYTFSYNPLNNYMYAATMQDDTVHVINATDNKLIGRTIYIGHDPRSITYDPYNKYMYVANKYSSSLSIISFSSCYNVTFTENKLPSNMSWCINIRNVASSGPIKNKDYSIYLGNLTYNYTVLSSNDLYRSSHDHYSITVNGKPLNETINFVRAYNVTFVEKGLNQETMWYVNLGNGNSYKKNINEVKFTIINGTYNYSVTAGLNYNPHTINGTFTVNGKPSLIYVNFSKVTYNVNFIETGLPTGITWSVNFIFPFYKYYNTSNSAMTLNEINGTYIYTVSVSNKDYIPLNSSGFYILNGNNKNIVLSFKEIEYNITFKETGLLNGTIWYLNLSNGESYKLKNDTITIELPNGTYSYKISTNSKYKSNITSGTLKVNGNDNNTSIKFSKFSHESTPFAINRSLIVIILSIIVIIGSIAVIITRKRKK